MKKLLLSLMIVSAFAAQSLSAIPAFAVKVPFADKVTGLFESVRNAEISETTKDVGKVGAGVLGLAVLGYAGYKLYNWFTTQSPRIEEGARRYTRSVLRGLRTTDSDESGHILQVTQTWTQKEIIECLRNLDLLLSERNMLGQNVALSQDLHTSLTQLRYSLHVIANNFDIDKQLATWLEDSLGDQELAKARMLESNSLVAHSLIKHIQKITA